MNSIIPRLFPLYSVSNDIYYLKSILIFNIQYPNCIYYKKLLLSFTVQWSKSISHKPRISHSFLKFEKLYVTRRRELKINKRGESWRKRNPLLDLPFGFQFHTQVRKDKPERNLETEKERRDVSKRFVRQNVLDSKTTNSTLEERERAAAINEIAAA